jgi:hypothetical protein
MQAQTHTNKPLHCRGECGDDYTCTKAHFLYNSNGRFFGDDSGVDASHRVRARVCVTNAERERMSDAQLDAIIGRNIKH